MYSWYLICQIIVSRARYVVSDGLSVHVILGQLLRTIKFKCHCSLQRNVLNEYISFLYYNSENVYIITWWGESDDGHGS